MQRKKAVFITGTTGLVGSYLAKVFLENDHKVYALARPKNNKSARERVIEVLKFWDEKVYNEKSNNLTVLEGDITEENLGLNRKSIDILKNEVEEIFHCAAVTKFNWEENRILKINLNGTKNILELSCLFRKEGNLKKINHLSTIFIYGNYEDVFIENHLDLGQKFNNTYSKSKFEAEKLVHAYRESGLWIDIFRPAIIVGESTTGKIISFNRAFYQAIRNWNLEVFDYYPGKDSYFLNITFLDELCKSIFLISSNPLFKNKTYHAFGTSPASLEEIISSCSEFLGFKKPILVSKKDFLSLNPTLAQRKILQYNFFFKDSNVKLDSIITNELLKKYNFSFSNFNKKLLFNLLNYAVKAGFLFKK